MTVEGINLTPELIDNIKWYQENEDSMELAKRAFDRAIKIIAIEGATDNDAGAAESLKLISELYGIKDVFISLAGKEVCHG